MKKKIYIILVVALLLASYGCKKEDETTKTYPEALVTSMTFAKNDSIPGLAEASFTIITATDTGLIYNKDSLRFGTTLDSVIPYVTFNHTPSYSVFFADSDTIIYSGSDTISFVKQPVRLYVMASDREHEKWYDIYVNVHQVDPDLYQWGCINSNISDDLGGETKAVLLNGRFYFFVSNGISTRVYGSSDAISWTAPQVVSTLPRGCSVRNIIEAEGVLYYADGDKLFTSTDAINWSAADYSAKDFRLVNMLYSFNDSIWAIAQRTADDKLQLCNMAAGGEMALTGEVLPDNFPISDYAALSFASASNRKRAMIVGGYDLKGNALNTRWNFEYLLGRGYSMTNFSIEQPNFEALTGVSIVWYDHAFHMFGSVNADHEVGQYTQLISHDEGLHWVVPDSAKNCLPEAYQPRQKASVIVDNQHFIYIFGGQSRTQTFFDVWRGRLNRTTFADYE